MTKGAKARAERSRASDHPSRVIRPVTIPEERSRVAVRRIVQPSGVGPGFGAVGPARDPVEKEANRVAERVTRTSEPEVAPDRPEPDGPDRPPTPAGSGGRRLPSAERGFMERRLGVDLSGVRIHTGAEADVRTRRISARAFTRGGDIWFRDGEYRPATEAGRRLLAHELVHVLQQSPNDRARSGGAFALRADRTGLVRREPGEDARDSWEAFAEVVPVPDAPERERRMRAAVSRLLATEEGREVVNQLWGILCGGRESCREVKVSAVGRGREEFSDEGGHVEPAIPDRPLYRVYVVDEPPDLPRGQIGTWPAQERGDRPWITYTHRDPETGMAATLFHELLHVWFIHAHRDVGGELRTGHAASLEDEETDIHDAFLQRLKEMHRDLEDREEELGAEARAGEGDAGMAEARPLPEGGLLEGRSETPEESDAGPAIGAIVEARAGGGAVSARGTSPGDAGRAGAGAGILGVDVLLGRIWALRLGFRGVYMTPDRLAPGAAVGFRALTQPGGGPGSREGGRPIFFDLEAGVVAELPATDARRLSEALSAYGSAGFGEEFGRSGGRFFWRIGGFVIISDEEELGGGGTLGAGVRF